MRPSGYTLDPDDPRAPSVEEWEAMSPSARRVAVAALPSEIPREGAPEGDTHRIPKERALQALREFFRRRKRRVYLSSELPVYYPGERVFGPDVLAVLDVDPGPRDSWVVSKEGRGLDFVLEVLVHNHPKKDLEDNVTRYASLGIAEYFVFEPLRRRIHGYRLTEGETSYRAIVPQEGRWASGVLGLDLAMELDRVRFFVGSAPLPEAEELIVRLNDMLDDLSTRDADLVARLRDAEDRAEGEKARAEGEKARAEGEKARADRLAQRLRALGEDPDRD